MCPMDNPATERKIKSWVQRCSWRIGEEGKRTDGGEKEIKKKGEREKEEKGEGRGSVAPVERREGPR